MSLEILTSDLLLGARHGFFTRRGGTSGAAHAALKCGPGSGEPKSAVGTHRAQLAPALGIAPDRLLSLHQTHSATVVTAGPAGWAEPPRADAAVTAAPGIALSVLTADCAPVLLHDAEAGVIGAAHAGWRGALGGVIGATVTAMEQLGADPGRIRAAVGPTISQRVYEVGPEFLDAFLDEDPSHGRFFVNGDGDRYLFDLPGFVLGRLRAAGVAESEWIGECTFSNPARYHSYRRKTKTGEAAYGRLVSAIAL